MLYIFLQLLENAIFYLKIACKAESFLEIILLYSTRPTVLYDYELEEFNCHIFVINISAIRQ